MGAFMTKSYLIGGIVLAGITAIAAPAAVGGTPAPGAVAYLTGDNTYGQALGNGATDRVSHPKQVGANVTWARVAAGGSSTVAIRSDGTLWAWGYNSYGQLGDGTTTSRSHPVRIGNATNWIAAAAGFTHTVALRADGTLWAWGYNHDGQLGDGTTVERHAPEQIGPATTWTRVAAGTAHTVALRADGTLWAWGANGSGQLGDGTTTERHIPGTCRLRHHLGHGRGG